MKFNTYVLSLVLIFTVSTSNAASKSDTQKLPEKAETDKDFVSQAFAIRVPQAALQAESLKTESVRSQMIIPASSSSSKIIRGEELEPQASVKHNISKPSKARAPASIPTTPASPKSFFKSGVRVVVFSEKDFASKPKEAPLQVRRALKNRDRVSSSLDNNFIEIEN